MQVGVFFMLGAHESACLKHHPARKSLAGLIKRCSRVLHWFRLTCTISRFPRSHDRALLSLFYGDRDGECHTSGSTSRFTAVKRVTTSEIQCIRWFDDVDRSGNDFFCLHSSSIFTKTLISPVGGRRRVDRRDHPPSVVLFFAMRSQRIV